MFWLILLLLILAAAFGVLEVVLKVAVAFVLFTIAAIIIAGAIAAWALRRWVRDHPQGGSTIWTLSPGDRRLPGPRDDRY
jgi:heme A synthase